MKQITFIRHAKSNHVMGLRDHDRPLNERGLTDAPLMAERLKTEQFSPDIMYSSTALRALNTAQLIRDGIKPDTPLIEDALLYHAFIHDYTRFIHELDDTNSHIAIVGHNPTITMMVNLLSKENVTDSMPTCCVVTITFAEADSWQLISPHTGIVNRFMVPVE
ncbi:MAG: SixA phosphatase family protein [Ignavibacteria bacterium]|jgi:phosphohistidine phosphatase|nr:phosphoglycerate mutase [Chlorobiota bacterium]